MGVFQTVAFHSRRILWMLCFLALKKYLELTGMVGNGGRKGHRQADFGADSNGSLSFFLPVL